MTIQHKDITGLDAVHPGAVFDTADPGAIGARKAWYDTTDGLLSLRVRNAANDGWDEPNLLRRVGRVRSGVNQEASATEIYGERGTGDSTPAPIIFYVPVRGSSGSTPQTLTEGFRVQEVAAASGREVAAWNPTGPVMAGLPLNTAASLLRTGQAVRFGGQGTMIRVSAAPNWLGLRVNGSYDSPTNAVSGDTLVGLSAITLASDGNFYSVGRVEVQARETPTGTANGTRLALIATAVGSASTKTIVYVQGGGTSIGELVSGQPTLRLIPGATQFAIRDSGNTADVFTVNAAGTAITAPLATSFVVGTDPGGSALLRVGGNIATVGAVLATSALSRNVSTGSFTLSGGNGATNGGNVVGYGGSHPTQANDIEFRSGSTVRGWWDDSAALWTFDADHAIGAAHAYHLGAPATDGTWRFIRSGTDLLIQRRESGTYVTKSTISA
ncbi:MAG: hypothetical protein KIS74_03045 [Burkholderiales bacterium]|nr:hypothetical protein [Burkholderiales bacterium]